MKGRKFKGLLLISLLLLFVVSLLSHGPSFAQETVEYNATKSATIGSPSEIDAYTLIAEPGDRILLGLLKTSGELWPKITVLNSEGATIATEFDSAHLELTIEVEGTPDIDPGTDTDFWVYLPFITKVGSTAQFKPAREVEESISFTILIEDGFSGERTGSYNLFAQKLHSSIGATDIGYADNLLGQISKPGEIDAFVIDGKEGEVLLCLLYTSPSPRDS